MCKRGPFFAKRKGANKLAPPAMKWSCADGRIHCWSGLPTRDNAQWLRQLAPLQWEHMHTLIGAMRLQKKAFAMRCSAAAIETHAQMRCSASMRIVATIDTTDGNDNDTDDIVAGYRTLIC